MYAQQDAGNQERTEGSAEGGEEVTDFEEVVEEEKK